MRNLGGLMAGVATAALGFVDPGLCSIEDAGGGGGGGGGGAAGAAALLEEDPAAAAAAAAAAPADDPAAAAAAAAAAEPVEVADWMKSFSADKAGDDPSNQEWLAKTGIKDLDGLAKIARDNQRALRESGKVKIPTENATDEERAAFREAIGAPKEAAGYEVVMPEGAKDMHIDTAVIDPLKAVAHKHGVPSAAFKEMADVFLGAAVEDAASEIARTNTEAADQVKEWGAEASQRTEEFRRGARLLGLSQADIADIQREYGGGKTLALFAKVGALAGEDYLASGNPSQRFGVATLEQAQNQLNAMVDDKGVADLLRAKDPATVAKYNRLVDAVASFRELAAKKR